METVARIFFSEMGSVPQSKSVYCAHLQEEPFCEAVRKHCAEAFAEGVPEPLLLRDSLSAEIAALIDSIEAFSPAEKESLATQVMEQIKDMLASGEEEEVLVFLEGLLQADTNQELANLIESFLVQEENVHVFEGNNVGLAKDVTIKDIQGVVIQELQNTVFLEEHVETEQLKEVEKVVKDAEHTLKGEMSKIRPSVKALEQMVCILRRQLKSANEQVLNRSQSITELEPFLNNVEVNTQGIPLADMVLSSEEVVEAKISFLQTIKEMAEKAEFRQGVQSWEAQFELKPPQLGKTFLRMEMAEHKMTLDIFVAKPEAQEAVQNSLSELEQIFQDKGIVLEEVHVEVNPHLQFSQGSLAQESRSENASRDMNMSRTGMENISFGDQEVYSPDTLFLETERINCFA